MQHETITLAAFADKVRLMREAQIIYFSTRTQTALSKAKSLEKKVDELLKEVPALPKAEQTSLFT